MAQTFTNIAGTDFVSASRQVILDRDEANRTSFSGTAYPTSPAASKGQLCYRTDLSKFYVCTNDVGPVWTEIGVAGVYLALAGGTLTGVLNEAKGANIASAATVNLDTATGNFLHITGTTQISTITLAAGAQRLVVFDGALNIVNGANLVCIGAQDLLTRAGDIAIFVGDGTSITKMAGYWRADGSPVKSGAKGANIASAGTLNLDTATGDLVHITGTTTVTAITLASGVERTCIFDGILTLTHGASLLLPAARNHVTDAGAVYIFRGDGGGVVKCVGYLPAAGLMHRGLKWLPLKATGWVPRTTNGAGSLFKREGATNRVNRQLMPFDGAAKEYAQFDWDPPSSWDRGVIYYRVRWENASGTGNVVWGLQGVAISNDDPIDAAMGSAVEVTDGVTASGDLMVSDLSTAVTIGGTPANMDTIFFQVYRDGAAGGDTLNAIDADMLSVDILVGVNEGLDA